MSETARRITNVTRDEMHILIGSLPESELDAVALFLQPRVDPLLWALYNAPWDDEPEDDEERAAVEEARADIAAGRVSRWEDVQARLFRDE